MDAINELFTTAIEDGRIHGVSVLARDTKGTVNVKASYGVRSLDSSKTGPMPMQDDTPMRMASATKFLTSIMALQCVERGEVSLDDTLDVLLPEVAKLKVLTGFDPVTDQPVERDPTTPITLRHLLSHSSGLTYVMMNPLTIEYRRAQGKILDQGYKTVHENFDYPLVFDPGSDWSYSPGLDWCTRLITRASGQTAEECLQSRMVQALGIQSPEMTFDLTQYPEAYARHADVVLRETDDNGTSRLRHDASSTYWDIPGEPSGGQGIFCTPRAYMEVMYSVLMNDGRILKPETRNLLFESALTPQAENALNRVHEEFQAFHIGAPVPVQTRKSHSVGGLLALEDCEPEEKQGWRRKGSLSWAGITNVFWNIDPEAGICCFWAFHSKPFGDVVCVDLGKKFEKLVYKMLV